MRKSKTGKKIKPFTDEHKRKISLANGERLRKMNAERAAKVRVKCPETGKAIWVDNVINQEI